MLRMAAYGQQKKVEKKEMCLATMVKTCYCHDNCRTSITVNSFAFKLYDNCNLYFYKKLLCDNVHFIIAIHTEMK